MVGSLRLSHLSLSSVSLPNPTAETLSLDEEFELYDPSRPATLSNKVAASLTPEVPEEEAQHEGRQCLNGLTTLTLQEAQALAKHEGNLSLNGLTTLTLEVADALAQHKGWLQLDGVTTLSDEAIMALAQHKGGLSLRSLRVLSEEVAEALQRGRLWGDTIVLPDRFETVWPWGLSGH
jgi:hypothetical protein